MLDIFGSHQSHCCNGSSRRNFLKVGALGTTGLALPDLLRAQALGHSGTKTPDKTVIWLFLSGGPTHYETFDPKPDNPLPFRSTVGTLQTNVPGTQIGGLFPRLAKLADKYSIIRSLNHHDAGHSTGDQICFTGYNTGQNPDENVHPSCGSIVAEQLGHLSPELPAYVMIPKMARLTGPFNFDTNPISSSRTPMARTSGTRK